MNKTSHTRTCIFVIVLLIGATLGVYIQTGGFDFISVDDSSYVYQNPHVRTGLTWDNIRWSLTAAHSSNWHPVTWMSHMIDCQIYGLNAGGHHVTNLLIHIINSVLLFLLLVRVTGRTWPGAFVAALFALHPMNVESVAWIAERKNVLSTLFWILTVWFYVDYTRRRTPGRYVLVLVSFALGLMAKPMLVTLPLVLLVLDGCWLKHSGGWRSRILDKLPLFTLVVVSCVVTMVVQREGGMVRPLDQFTLGERLANAIVSYTAYIWKMMWPADLCILYPHPGNGIPIWKVVGAAVVFTLATTVAVLARRRYSYITLGWFWYVIALVPVIGIVQVGPQAMADRYAYVPLIGIFIIISLGISDLFKPAQARNGVLSVLAVSVLVVFTACTWRQAGYWRNGETVVKRAVQVTRNHLPTTTCLVASLIKGDMTDQALHVLRSTPDAPATAVGVGVLMARVKMYDLAEVVYREAVRLDPHSAIAHNNLGTTLARLGKTDEAIDQLTQAAGIDPNYAEPHSSLGYLYLKQGKPDEAIRHLRAALKVNPELQSAREYLNTALTAESENNE